MKIIRSISSLVQESKSFLQRAYPEFVTASHPRPLDSGQVIVFMFHTVKAQSFELQLQHLTRNGYRTIDSHELYLFLTGKTSLAGPSVVLSFDDGERSLYNTAFPLLKKYGMKAVNFIVTGRVFENGQDRPAQGKQWLTWAEVLEMHRAGVIDFQSHTYLHETMFAGDQLRGFTRPGIFTDELLVDRPLVKTKTGEQLLLQHGAPMYDMSPRMMDKPKFFDREDVRDACIDFVAANGGDIFFQQSGWQKILTGVWQKAKGDHPAGTFENAGTQRTALLDSLSKSRTILADRLNKPVEHIAYPWNSRGKLAVELSKEAGYLTNFRGPIPGQSTNKPGQNLFSIARIKDDYLLRLPGEGRSSLTEILSMKFQRRASQEDIY